MSFKIGRKTFTTREDIVLLKKLYNDGLNYKQIADKMDLSKTWVISTCKKLLANGELKEREKITKDILRRQSKKIPFKNNVDTGKVFALWHAGWSVDEIAGDMELNPKQVIKVLDSEV